MRSRTPAITASSAARSPSWARATSVSIGVVTVCVCSISSISATNGTGHLGPEKDRQDRELLGQGRSLRRKDLVGHAGELELREDVLGSRVIRDNTGVGDGLQPRRHAYVKVNRTLHRIGD